LDCGLPSPKFQSQELMPVPVLSSVNVTSRGDFPVLCDAPIWAVGAPIGDEIVRYEDFVMVLVP